MCVYIYIYIFTYVRLWTISVASHIAPGRAVTRSGLPYSTSSSNSFPPYTPVLNPSQTGTSTSFHHTSHYVLAQ